MLGIALCLFAARLGAAVREDLGVRHAPPISRPVRRGASRSPPTGACCSAAALVKVEGVSEPVLFGAVAGKGGECSTSATGDSGKILRVTAAGKVEIEAQLTEQEVTAARGRPGRRALRGRLAGREGLPRSQGGKPSLYYDTKAQYVWALAFDGPTLYVGDGASRRDPPRDRGRQGRARSRDDRRARPRALRRRGGPALGRHVGLGPRAPHGQGRARRDRLRLRRSPRSPRSRRTAPAASGSPSRPRRTRPREAASRSPFPSVLPAGKAPKSGVAGRGRGQAARPRSRCPFRPPASPPRAVRARRILVRGPRLRGGRAAAQRLDELRGDRLRPRARPGGRRRARGDRAPRASSTRLRPTPGRSRGPSTRSR